MLRLEKIVKTYKTADMDVVALKGIDLAFRKSEFVSILGPSGCGKTTLLNVIGGLDHYDDGDLFILGKSTKEFKDHDWDVYRNHRVGFVFQSYNLIPQENLLENVELGLTIAGLSKKEREAMAKKALDRVGLEGLYKKYPNQLSGGQSQRVAIARAIVNNPDIILADEPTGALDSVTSLQVMDILKEIAKDRLVIMVTHNPDLAEKYSTRIISLLDGNVVGDTSPYSDEEEAKERGDGEVAKSELKSNLSRSKEEEKAKMSWLTAFVLSAKNLWVKAKRTAMIVVASSIGIVGVSAVLAVSSGVTDYINSIQDDLLSGNPIRISRSNLSLTSLMGLSDAARTASSAGKSLIENGYIDVNSLIEELVEATDGLGDSLTTNDISSDYIAWVDEMPSSYYAAVDKNYGIDPLTNIYSDASILDAKGNNVTCHRSVASFVNYAVAIISQSEYSTFASQIPAFTDLVNQCIDNEEYILSQYDVVAGKVACEENELMIVLDHNNRLSDLMLTMLGYFGYEDLMNYVYYYGFAEDDPIRQAYFTPERQADFEKRQKISVEELMGKQYHYYPNDIVFRPTTKTRTVAGVTREYDTFDYLFEEQPLNREWLDSRLDMNVVGILAPKESVNYGCLDAGLYYTPAFSRRFIEDNRRSEIVEQINATGTITSTVNTYYDSITREKIVDESNVTYHYDIYFYPMDGEPSPLGSPSHEVWYAPVGTSQMDITSALMAWFSMASGGENAVSMSATLTKSSVGGSKIPSSIAIYPNSFDTKYLVTEHLDRWNSKDTLYLSNGDIITPESRSNIQYTDNLELILSMIHSIIEIVTIALVALTSLSLVVSTVMISIITYVSVIERVKEIGVIRSLGGRKKDVRHLFNAETFMIGGFSGIFGIIVTYLLQVIVNLVLSINYGLTMMSFKPWTALIVLVIAILLTILAGLLPASSAARKDPVTALRTE